MYLSKKLITIFFPQFKKFNDIEISNIFNSLGIELESIFTFEETKNLIVGEIISVKKHETSNKLTICNVNIGSEIKEIICGAENVAANKKVIVALHGTTLFDGKIIEDKDICGIKSQGMICAYNELTSRIDWINKKESDEIVVLPDNAKVGDKSPLNIIGFDDKIFEISVPSNRNELNSIFGIIYEIQSLLNIKKKYDFTNLKNMKNSDLNIKNILSETYSMIKIKNENYNNSNWILKSFLMNSGITPSNTIEDLSKMNQILCGVPFMTFSNINKNKLEVCKLDKSLNIELNNYGKVALKSGDIVLKNGDNIVALMNIDVTKEYAINDESKDIYFFSSLLDYIDIRKTANRLKIMNEHVKSASKDISSWWFKKSLDVFIGNLKPKFNNILINHKYKSNDTKKIKLDYEKINNILGINFTQSKIKKILNSFDYKITNNISESPINRVDVENDHDLIEDILKVKGIQNIEESPITNSVMYVRYNYEKELINQIKNILIYRGFYLIKNYNLTSKKNNEEFNYFDYEKDIKINNAISSDREYLKLSLIEGVLSCYSYNESLKNKLLPIFEIQDIYYGNIKRKHLIIAMAKNININIFNKSEIKNDIFFLKSILQTIALITKNDIDFKKYLEKNWSCKEDSLLVNFKNKNIGYITRMNPNILKNFKIKSEEVYLAEIDITDLIKENNDLLILESLNNKHKITRELSILLPKDYDLNTFYKIANKNELINELLIIDAFEKNDEISYSIKFNLKSEENDIKNNLQKVLNYFKENNFKIIE